jgi:hypothetical protein
MAIGAVRMKLKLFIRFFITLGILSAAPYLRATPEDTTTSSTNAPAQSSPTNHPQQFATAGGHGASYVNRLGIGAQLISPYGVTVKYFFTDCIAVDGAAGWETDSHNTGEIHADVLFHDFEPLRDISHTMPVYYGAGLFGRFRNDNNGTLGGFRFPIGVSYMFNNSRFDVFGEVAPELIFSPFVRGGIRGSVGIRFWF